MLEAACVLASPAILYVILSLRGMAPPRLPDPSMHTTLIVAPHDIFTRYAAVLNPSARLREAARVGFLVPARLSYLLFGAVPGFFVFRYVLVLVAIVPAYLLMRRLYGRWAGALAIVLIMSSPVLITAWGTDYPDSAAVSYLTGGLAALALACLPGRFRQAWVLLSGGLLTLAVWSHGVAVPLAGVAVVVFLGVRLARGPRGLLADLGLLAASAIVVTLLLAILSSLLLGQFNFISPTIRAEKFLSTPAQERLWHSANWAWAPYDAYLLVPPAVIAAFAALHIRRRRPIGTAQLFLALCGALQLAVFAYLQFFSSVQTLEMHYLSSTLWSSTTLLLALVIAEVSLPLAGARRLAWLPALLVLAVGVAYASLQPRVPAMMWIPGGAALVLLITAGAVIGRLGAGMSWAGTSSREVGASRARSRTRLSPAALSVLAILVIAGATLILTVAPRRAHAVFANTTFDPPTAYATALGGSDRSYVQQYQVSAELPGFVGHPAYRGEQLLTWWPRGEAGILLDPMGIYHASFNTVSFTFPFLGPRGASRIEQRHAAQVLLMSTTGRWFSQAVTSLSSFRPEVARRGVINAGSFHLHVWLVDLGRYLRRSGGGGTPPAPTLG